MNQLRRRILERIQPWCIDSISRKEDSISISGWAVSGSQTREHLEIQSCGASLTKADFKVTRPDLESVFPFWPQATNSGFTCDFRLQPNLLDKEIRFSYGDKNIFPFNPFHEYVYPLDDCIAVPDPSGRLRVHGSDSLPSFLLEGYSTFRKLSEIISSTTTINKIKNARILDWGCGCGRVSRYFDTKDMQLWGADIDDFNLKWCEEQLNMKTLGISSNPTKNLPDSYFDLIFGISVMTHLHHDLQIAWLDELTRSLKSSGYLILTFHGLASALRNISDEGFEELLSQGFYDFGENPILKGAVPENKDYRDTYNTLNQIVLNWTEKLRVTKYFESLIGNHQDLIVLQKI